MSWEQLNLDLITGYGLLVGLLAVVAVLRFARVRAGAEPGRTCP